MAGSFWLALAMLWLAGNCLRLTILAVPPVIPLITRDLALSATEVGVLGSIPPALFAVASLPGALLISRVGVLRALVIGLLLTALGGALRGLSLGTGVLFATSILMALGVAFMQPALPPAVQQWMPRRIGIGTAVYTNGLLLGEVFPVFLTLPLVMPWFDGAWRPSLAVWSAPVLVTAVLVAAFAPRQAAHAPGSPPPRRRWWPDWRDGLVWQLGALAGGISSMYFATNAFLPGYLTSIQRPDLTGSALTALNLGQLPASFLLLAAMSSRWAGKLERRAWPYVATGALSFLGIAGIVLGGGPWTVFWAGLLGFAGSAGLILALTLPAFLSPPAMVATNASAMFALSYATAVVVGVVSGALWDLTGVPAAAFVPIGMGALLLIGSALLLRARGRLR